MKIEEKTRLINELKEELTRLKGFWVTDFTGLPVEAMTKLRRNLHDNSFNYRVAKKFIFKRVLQELNIELPVTWTEGSIGICMGNDIALGCRILTEFQKEASNFKIKGCWFNNRAFSLADIKEIVTLPPRDVLVIKVLTTLKLPIYRLVQVFQSLLLELLQVLAQIRESKGG